MFVADLNFDQLRRECQRSTSIDGWVSGQNKVGNPRIIESEMAKSSHEH